MHSIYALKYHIDIQTPAFILRAEATGSLDRTVQAGRLIWRGLVFATRTSGTFEQTRRRGIGSHFAICTCVGAHVEVGASMAGHACTHACQQYFAQCTAKLRIIAWLVCARIWASIKGVQTQGARG